MSQNSSASCDKMASRQKQKRDRIWNFEVSDPTLHPNGFTIYKITCKVFVVTSPDSLTEIVVWKRYNDFKQLYKATNSLHKALHRKDEFPTFAKPKLFGRFDDSVIEERRTSALNLLNFIGQHSYLYRSRVFLEFFEGGQKTSGTSGEILKPSKLDILNTENISETDEGQRSKEVLQPIKHPPDTASNLNIPSTERAPSPSGQEQSESDEMHLEGVWNFPQVPDNISLNSYEDTDEASVNDVESALGTPLPDTDISFFDPLQTDDKLDISGTPELRTSSSWLFAAMNTCADMDEDDIPDSPRHKTDEGGIQIDFDSMESTDDNVQTPVNDQDDFTSSSSIVDLSEFDPLKPRSESKVECGKGDLDLSLTRSIESSVGSGSAYSSSVSSPRSLPSSSPRRQKRMRSVTNESVSTMDLGGREDYIYVAANKICLAQECEAGGKYEEAFGHYKSGVGILLQGVQGDKNKSRRDAVRRKTAQYLMKAEDLYNRHLAHETLDERRWATDNMLSPSTDLDPCLAFIKAPITELKNFKVLGTVDKVLLVMDKITDETYIIKTFHKSSTFNRKLKSILPTSCPHMVSLHKFYETDNAMYLLLQYACGGKLWNYVSTYLQHNRNYNKEFAQNLDTMADLQSNVYTGHKCHDSDISNKIQTEVENVQSETPGINMLPNLDVKFNKENVDFDLGEIDVHDKIFGANISALDSESRNGHTSVGADDLKPEDFSFSFGHEPGFVTSPEDQNSSVKKVQLGRYASISSEETAEFNEMDQSESDIGSVEQKDSVFRELLQNNKTNLEHFSINSFDSNEGIERKDSFLSDNIESIPEESEDSPVHQLYNNKQEINCENNVIDQDQESKGNSSVNEDAELIVQSAKELIKSVERTLSQTDSEVEAVLYPDSLHSDQNNVDRTSGERKMFSDEQNVTKCKSDFTEQTHLPSSSKNPSVVNSCDTLTGDNDSNEVSIYDIHRSHDTNSSSESSDIERGHKTVVNDSVNSHSNSNVIMDENCDNNSSQERKNTITKDRTSSSENFSDESQKQSRSSTLTEQTHVNKITPPMKLSISRMNSNELTRSASFDRELTSPAKTRQRTTSGIFHQLDLAANSSDQIKLPESCIQQWAAEIVVALSVLHSEGIVCRDLKPSNILLGEKGHILLSYFCQLSNTDKELDFEAVDQQYVAPELKGITGYSDVCDWWSLGAILYELIVGKSLVSCHPGGITPHTQLSVPDHVSPEAQGLLRHLLCYSPRERLGAGINGAEDIKAHPFFNNIDWHALEN